MPIVIVACQNFLLEVSFVVLSYRTLWPKTSEEEEIAFYDQTSENNLLELPRASSIFTLRKYSGEKAHINLATSYIVLFSYPTSA